MANAKQTDYYYCGITFGARVLFGGWIKTGCYNVLVRPCKVILYTFGLARIKSEPDQDISVRA